MRGARCRAIKPPPPRNPALPPFTPSRSCTPTRTPSQLPVGFRHPPLYTFPPPMLPCKELRGDMHHCCISNAAPLVHNQMHHWCI